MQKKVTQELWFVNGVTISSAAGTIGKTRIIIAPCESEKFSDSKLSY